MVRNQRWASGSRESAYASRFVLGVLLTSVFVLGVLLTSVFVLGVPGKSGAWVRLRVLLQP